MRTARRVALSLVYCVAVFGRVVHGEALPESGRRAEFRADRVDLEPGKDALQLDGHVAVSVDRYRLTSDHLSLERSPRGIVVTGTGRVALCPCPDPPVEFSFVAATVAPPTDLLLEQPTLRIFGIPSFWLPYLWLRAPSRVGILPLQVAYRGKDGLLLGSGAHLPFTESTALDVSVAAYVRGGADVDARLNTRRTTTEIRWDWLKSAAVHLDLRGALPPDGGSTVAWTVDALRGARALVGPVTFEEAALRQDRARVFVGYAGDGAVIGLLGTASAARGGSFGTIDSVGPGAHVGYGAALGQHGAIDSDLGIATLQRPGNTATTLISQRGELRFDTRAGPVVASGEARTRAFATLGALGSGHAVGAGLGADVSLPFMKSFGGTDAPIQHWITPFIAGTGGSTDTTSASVVPALAHDGLFYAASGGIRSTLGETGGRRSAVSVAASGGAIGEGTRIPQAVVAWTARASAPFVALSGEGVSAVSGPEGRVVIMEARLGREDGPYIGGRTVEGNGSLPIASRLTVGGWDAPWNTWLERSGWSVGGRAGIPWTAWLASAVDADYDLTTRSLLSLRGTLAYRHPCGCLALTLWGGHRMGRGGVDSWLTVDLAR